MKLHSDILTVDMINDALSNCKQAGTVDRLVVFSELSARGSRSRKYGYEVRLEWLGDKQKGDGRRHTNGGNSGADTATYAAFWEEWGWFIAEMYTMDPELIFGHYKTLDGFEQATDYQFS